MFIHNHPGQGIGRYVIVQMNNGEKIPLNLKEVKAFGEFATGNIIIMNFNSFMKC